MQVVFEGHVTDISGRVNKVLRAEIPKPSTHATMLMLNDDAKHSRPQFLRPFESVGVHAMFFVQPVVGDAGKQWKTSIIFIDQYGNRHKVKNCVFSALPNTSGTQSATPPPR